jgi:hypothetical protein
MAHLLLEVMVVMELLLLLMVHLLLGLVVAAAVHIKVEQKDPVELEAEVLEELAELVILV